MWFSVIVKLEYRAQRPERPDISRSDRDRRPEPEAEQHSEQRAEMQCPVTNTPHTPYKIHTVTAYITRYTDAKT